MTEPVPIPRAPTAKARLLKKVPDLDQELDRALEGTFPASDPVSSLQVVPAGRA
ncbi:MAG TPA: hypothetical protein VGC16_06705 [Rhizomicrobium sp.]